jgi:hypothetical protein
MTRAGKITIGTVVVGGFLGFTAWKLVQPRYRFASRAEVEAVVDKQLLIKLPEGRPGAYEKARGLFKKHKADKAPLASDVAAYRRWSVQCFEQNRSLIQQVADLYEAGPVQPTNRKPDALDFPNFSIIKQFVKYSGVAAQDESSHGRTSGAVERLRLGYRLSDGYTANCETIIEYLIAVALAAIIDAATYEVVEQGTLSKTDLEQLHAIVKPFDASGTAARNAIIGDFQNYTLAYVPGLGIKEGDDPGRTVNALLGTGEEDENLAIGQYDALESAKMASTISMLCLANVNKPFAKIDGRLDTFVASLEKNLPVEDYSHLPSGPERDARKLWYRVKMNNSPNSLGKMLFATTSLGKSYLGAGAKCRTERQALIGLISLCLYKKQHGRYPERLEGVVSSGLLQEFPTDYMSGGRLIYRPAKQLLYSIGMDLKDDGGVVTMGRRPFTSYTEDWPYRLP